MKNIERFNLYTAHIFGVLYNEFPVPRMMHGREVVTAVQASLDLTPEEEGKQHKFVSYTLRWLQETGYIKAYGNDENRTFVLEPRAFEAMAAPLPKALRGTEEKVLSVGETLAGGFAKELAKETRKQVASQLVGQVIGHAMKAFSGSMSLAGFSQRFGSLLAVGALDCSNDGMRVAIGDFCGATMV